MTHHVVYRTDTGEYINAQWFLRSSEQVWTDTLDVDHERKVPGAARMNENDAKLLAHWQQANGVPCRYDLAENVS